LIIGGIVVIGIAGFVCALSTTGPTDLIARSKVVADDPGHGKSWDYFWLSDHEFEAFQYACNTPTASIQNITNGNSKFDNVLIRELQQAHWNAQDVSCALSPSGKNLLVEHNNDCAFSGGRLLGEFPLYADTYSVWIDDSHWVGMANKTSSAAVNERICGIDGTRQEFQVGGLCCRGHQGAFLLGTSTTGMVIVEELSSNAIAHSVDVSTCHAVPHATPSKHRVELPPSTYLTTGGYLGLPIASPDGRHIAWPLNLDRAHSLYNQRWFQAVMLRLHIRQPAPHAALWVSDVDGAHMHLIGTYGDPNFGDDIDGLRWMPDSKHLSFQGPSQKLYVVDAFG